MALVAVSREGDQGYTSLPVATSDAVLRAQVIGKALAELKAWQERYRSYNASAGLFDFIDASATLPSQG